MTRCCCPAGLPSNVAFASRWKIVLQLVCLTLDVGISSGIATDAVYGKVTIWWEQLAEWGLIYCVVVRDNFRIWAPVPNPCPSMVGGKRLPPRRSQQTEEHQETVLHALECAHYQTVTWLEATGKGQSIAISV
ncbi:transposase [Halomonas gemina]|uniref:transposase n=1 Tax=Halomonas gemina TaxID=2945105 RepID=UPI003D32A2B2